MQTIWRQLSEELSKNIANAGPSVVAVDGRGGHTSSGILWRPGYVLTANHALRQTVGIPIKADGGASARAEIIGRAPGVDAALLKLDREIAGSPAQFGE